MTSPDATDPVWQFLSRNGGRAFLLSEVAAAVRAQVPSEPDVAAAVEQLAIQGKIVSRAFPVRDRHLAFSSLQFVAAVNPQLEMRDADLLTQKAYQRWLSDWLSSHRCT